ncbi:serine/threonine protein kinase [Entamoeba histolytica HM-3:IMSS]|uniref:non-specific serine/threonine protein kinase n=2 Tax=Entamoeba histolytica TaxID=5759 RepID=M2SCG6_ENTHI|nr:serine/threonine protein kinase, putative [Entamoeba histolytica KU27]EMS14645.1 serine/threonine protein kinase [Entamoeba histolytica HM-3:IMSS]
MGNSIPFSTGTIQIEKKIGEGGFSQVYVGKDHFERKVAVKVMGFSSKDTLQRIENEIKIHKIASESRFVIKLLDSIILQQQHQIAIAMEFCSGTLVNEMEHCYPSTIGTNKIRDVMLCVSGSLAYLHSKGYCHRDIKIENVLIFNGEYKLTDFGSAIPTSTYLTRKQGDASEVEEDIEKHTTPEYRSPEMVKVYNYNTIGDKADVWAAGCLLYKLEFFVTPFDGSPMKIIRGSYDLPKPIEDTEKNWLENTLEIDQNKRWNSQDLFNAVKTNSIVPKQHLKEQITITEKQVSKQPSDTNNDDNKTMFIRRRSSFGSSTSKTRIMGITEKTQKEKPLISFDDQKEIDKSNIVRNICSLYDQPKTPIQPSPSPVFDSSILQNSINQDKKDYMSLYNLSVPYNNYENPLSFSPNQSCGYYNGSVTPNNWYPRQLYQPQPGTCPVTPPSQSKRNIPNLYSPEIPVVVQPPEKVDIFAQLDTKPKRGLHRTTSSSSNIFSFDENAF